MDYTYLAYAATEVYLIVYAATILSRLNMNLGSEYEVKELKNIIYAFSGVLVTDIFWALVEGNVFEPNPLLNAAMNSVSLSSVVTGCYFWYNFVEYRFHSKLVERKHVRQIMMAPAVCTVI